MMFNIIPNEQTPQVNEYTESIFTSEEMLIEIRDKFLEYAISHKNAVGLASNQCSLDNKRLMLYMFAIKKPETQEWELIINPIITDYFGIPKEQEEGCLTWEGKKIIAKRHPAIKVQYIEHKTSNLVHNTFYGYEAQIWQHEVNHLNGISEKVVDLDYKIENVVIGRNDKCPCDSGKKYKHCCIYING